MSDANGTMAGRGIEAERHALEDAALDHDAPLAQTSLVDYLVAQQAALDSGTVGTVTISTGSFTVGTSDPIAWGDQRNDTQNYLNELATKIHGIAEDHGFWDKPRNFGEMLMLIVREVSEALEADQASAPPLYWKHEASCAYSYTKFCDVGPLENACTCNPKPEGTAVELADAMIRILDTLGGMGVNIDKIVRLKTYYNSTRPRLHGKAY